jgi:hypothetical protein
MLPLMLQCRFQAASQKFGKQTARSNGAGSRELKERVERYENSKLELQQPRHTTAAQQTSSRGSIDNRVEKAAQQLQAATAELAEALEASGARASPAVVKVIESSITVMTKLLPGGR